MIALLVLAFTSPDTFQLPAEYRGGGGRLFTGSPASKWDCSVCHDIDETLMANVESDPPGLLTGGYTPGRSYALTVTLDPSPGTNSFGLEVTGKSGAVAGQLSNVDVATLGESEKCTNGRRVDPVEIRPGGTAAQSGGCKSGLNRWHLVWTAPASEQGALTFYLSAVASDGKADVANDRTVSRVFGVPSPATISQRTGGCGAPAALLLLPVLGLALLRKRALLLLVVLVPLSAEAAKKKKVAVPPPPPAAVETPAPVPAPVEEVKPAPEPPPVAAEPVPVPVPAPAPLEQPAPAPGAQDEADAPAAVEATGLAGFGARSLTQYSASFATPVRWPLYFPTAGASIRFYPVRLMRLSVLTGLEVEGSYQVGLALGALPPGASQALPADGRIALGYRFTVGALSIAPRFLFRMEVGGVERNALFEDAYYQSVGGELSIALQTRRGFFLEFRPGGGRVIDTGTASVKGYGPLLSGFSAGAVAAVGWRFGHSGISVTGHYSFSFTRAEWFGSGDRDYSTLVNVDMVHAGMLTLGVAR
jgi:hypothetical protein